MPSTLVIQSHATPLPFSWLQKCLDSVHAWATNNSFNYQFLGDELFDLIDPELRQKTNDQKVIATDLARLYALQNALQIYDRVVWLDADFLIFAPDSFILPSQEDLPEGYMLGREVWVQKDHSKNKVGGGNKLKANVKVHNAFMLFDRKNTFLNFYLQHAEKLLRQCEGSMPPQFIGPKLLTALHNVVQCPVMESAGMLSPLVLEDLLTNASSQCAINLFKKRSTASVSGANLCSSLQLENDVAMNKLIDKIVSQSAPI